MDVKKNGKDIGEIVFCGNICARGYYKDPAATQKLFAGGVLHSGDLAVWHEDGSVQILDREKDIIISGGENISSVALENALSKHPEILEVGVVGVADEVCSNLAFPSEQKCPELHFVKCDYANVNGCLVPRIQNRNGENDVKHTSQLGIKPKLKKRMSLSGRGNKVISHGSWFQHM